MALTYLYGIIPAAREVHFDVAGVDQAAIRTIAHKDLAAVVGGRSSVTCSPINELSSRCCTITRFCR